MTAGQVFEVRCLIGFQGELRPTSGTAEISVAPMQKPPPCRAGVSGLGSLTITYFHTGIRTIIGVESFHGPVRDGKGWDRLAMVIRQRGLLRCFAAQPIWEEAVILGCVYHTRESNLSLWIAASAFTRRRSTRQTCYRIKPYGQLVSVS